ncbi:MAG: glycosyltransferase family 39 protein [Candidatus Krumholzibacteriia bacterium]
MKIFKVDAPVLILLLAAASLMTAFPARVFECDAVIYACAGVHGDTVQNTDAGHLAWGGLELLAAGAGRSVHPPWSPIHLLRWLSMAAALGCAWLVYRVLACRLGIDPVRAALITGLSLFSYSFWHFALQAEPHAPHALFLAVFLVAGASLLSHPNPARGAATGLALGAATLLHQTSIILFPGVLLALWFTPGDGRTRLRSGTGFAGVYVLTAIAPYLAVGWFVRDLRTVPEFREWILGISTWGYWGNWRPTSLLAAAVGIVRSFVGSHYLLGVGGIGDLARRLFPAASWEDELMLAAAVPGWSRIVLIPVQAAVLGGMIVVMGRGIPRLRQVWGGRRALGLLLVYWLAVHLLFFTWWAPERAEFWIGFWLPLIVLLGPGIAAAGVGRRTLALLPAGLVLVNLLGSIAPQSVDLEPGTAAAVAIDPVARAGDVLLTDVPLGQRAGRFVYALDMVRVPADTARVVALVDSLLTETERRGNTLFWVGWRPSVPPGVLAAAGAGKVVAVRAPVTVLPLIRAVGRRGPDG